MTGPLEGPSSPPGRDATGARSYIYNLKDIAGFSADAWQKITCPTLILHASRDSFVTRSHTVELANLIPHVQMDVIDADHLMVVNDAPEVIKHIEAFV